MGMKCIHLAMNQMSRIIRPTINRRRARFLIRRKARHFHRLAATTLTLHTLPTHRERTTTNRCRQLCSRVIHLLASTRLVLTT